MTDVKLAAYNRSKRVVDLVAIVVTAPITILIGVVTSLLVRLRLGSPVLFTQRRVGLNDRDFDVLKFRTMTDERDERGDLLPDSDRLTKVGRVLRSTSLDEVPQLLNVARGEMSLVGPRPLFVRYLPHYTAEERERHRVRPGITGLAQVSGRNGVEWDQRLQYDVQYVRSASLLVDLKILAGTVWQVLRRQDISVLASDSGEPLDVVRSYPTDGSLSLRRLRAQDLATRVEWIADPRVREHMQWPDDISLESTQEWFARVRRDRDRIDYVAESGGQIVGMAGLRMTDPGTAEFYIFVHPERHGQGWGKRISALVLTHGQEVWGAEAVTLTVGHANVAAYRIYLSLGFEVTVEDEDRLWMRCARS